MSDKTIDRRTLPLRRPEFKGVVQRTLEGSKPDWEYTAPIRPPSGAPNVLVILPLATGSLTR